MRSPGAPPSRTIPHPQRIYGPAGHYGAGDVFLTRLLEDGTARAASPESANLHLVPTFPFEWGDSGGGENLVEHLARVVEDMNSTAAGAAALARRGGTDFVLLATGDRGACTLRPPLTSLVVAAEYGQTRAGGGGGGPGGWCMHPLRGVVLPTAITDPAAACREAALTYGGDGGGGEDTKMVGGGAADPGPAHHQPARDLLLYFSGVLGNRGDATYAQVRWGRRVGVGVGSLIDRMH